MLFFRYRPIKLPSVAGVTLVLPLLGSSYFGLLVERAGTDESLPNAQPLLEDALQMLD